MAKGLNNIDVSLNVTANTQQAANDLKSLQNQLQGLMNNPVKIIDGTATTKEINQANQAVAQLRTSLEKSTNSMTGVLNLTKFNNELKNSGMSLSQYRQQLSALGPAGQTAFANLARSIAQAETPLLRTNKLFAELKTTLMNTMRWQISSSAMHAVVGGLQSAYYYAKDLNESLNNIRIVTGASTDKMAEFAKQANTAAKNLSTTTTTYTDAALIYYQQGLSDREVKERTDVTIKMANAAGVSAKTVSDQMTAVWNNFDNGSKSLEYYADVMTALGAATASSTSEISQGLEKFASVANVVGLSYENAAAALATITATTRQSADTVGTGLRTLFSRFQSLSLGETLDDGVTLTKYSKALEKIGVSVLDASGNLRSMDNILEDMGSKWDTLNQSQKVALAQTVGGVRQYTTLVSLMDNFDFYKQNQETALGSEGTVQKQADIYAESWEAAEKRVKASLEGLVSDLLSDDFFIKITNFVGGLTETFDGWVKSLGGLKGLFMTVLAYSSTFNKQAFSNRIANTLQGIYNLTLSGRADAEAKRSDANSELVKMYQTPALSSKRNVQAIQAESSMTAAYLANASKMSADEKYRAQMIMDAQRGKTQAVIDAGEKVDEANASTLRNQVSLFRGVNAKSVLGIQKGNAFKKELFSPEEMPDFTRSRPKNFDSYSNSKQRRYLDNEQKQVEAWRASHLDSIYSLPNSLQANRAIGALNTFSANRPVNQITGDYVKTLMSNLQNSGITSAAFEKIAPNFAEAIKDIENIKVDSLPEGDKEVEQEIIDKIEALFDFPVEGVQNNIKDKLDEFVTQYFEKEGKSPEEIEKVKEDLHKTLDSAEHTGEEEGHQELLGNNARVGDKPFGEKFTSGLQKTSQALTDITSGLSTGLMAVQSFSNALNIIGDSASTNEQKLGAFLSMTTSLVPVLSSITTAIMDFKAGGGWTSFLGPIAMVASVVASFAIPYLDKLFESDSEYDERMEKQGEIAKESAEEARQAYNNLVNGFDSHNDLLDSLNEMTEGTNEFKNALIEANVAARDLINKYNLTFGEDYTIGDDGRIEFTQQGKENALTRSTAEVERTDKANQGMSIYNSIFSDEETRLSDLEDAIKNDTNLKGILGGDADYEAFLSDFLRNVYNPTKEESITQQMAMALKAVAEERPRNSGGRFSNPKDISKNFVKKYEDALKAAGKEDLATYAQSLYDQYVGNTAITNDAISNYVIESLATNRGSRATDVDKLIAQDVANQISSSNFKDAISKYTFRDGDGKVLDSVALNGTTKIGDLRKVYEDMFGEVADQALTVEQLLSTIQGNLLIDYIDARTVASRDKYWTDKKTGKAISESEQNRIEAKWNTANQLAGDLLANQIKEVQNNENAIEAERILAEQAIKERQTAIENLRASGFEVAGMELTDVSGNGNLTDEYAAVLNKFIEKMSTAQIDQFTKLSSNFQGLENSNWAFQNLMVDKQSGAYNSDLGKQLANMDYTNNFTRFIDMSKAFDNTQINKATREEIGILKNAFMQDVGPSEILNDLYGMESMTDDLKAFQKEMKKTGKLSASSITEAAEANEDLANYLEYSEMNAQSLADALEMVGDSGTLSIENLTNGFLKAIAAATQLEGTLQDTYSFIDSYQQTRSTQDIGDFYSGLSKTVQTELSNGKVGGDLLYESWSQFFGQESSAQLAKSFGEYSAAGMSTAEANAQFNKDYAEQIAVLQAIQKDGDLSNLFDYYTKQQTTAGKTTAFTSNTDGSVTVDMDTVQEGSGKSIRDMTTDEYVDYIKDTFGITEELARSMAMDQISENEVLWESKKRADGKAGIEELKDSENGPITQKEADAYWEKYGQYLDKYGDLLEGEEDTLENRKKLYEQEIRETNKILQDLGDKTKYRNENGELTSKGKKQWAKESGYINSEGEGDFESYLNDNKVFATDINDTNIRNRNLGKVKLTEDQTNNAIEFRGQKIADIDAYTKALQKAGLSIEEINADIESTNNEGMVFSKTVSDGFGNTTTYIKEAGESVDQFNERVKTGTNISALEEQAKIFASAFRDAFLGEDGITIEINDENIQATQEALENLKGDYPATVSVEHSSLDAAVSSAASLEGTLNTLTSQPYTISLSISGVKSRLGGFVPSYATGSGGRKLPGGMALTGEQGPELIYNADLGYSYMVGKDHPEFTMLHPGDRVFNNRETQQIVNGSSIQNHVIYGSFENGTGYGSFTFGGTSGGANSKNSKTAKFDPERYHVITREIANLNAEYNKLEKAREHAYGTNILTAIDKEIDATQKLINAQDELIKQAEAYREQDLNRLRELGVNVVLDDFGNLANFEELQETIGRAATENKDDETAQNQWKAIQQYESTLDKIMEAQEKQLELVYKDAELRLERVTEKASMQIDFDDKELKLIDHFLDKINDDIYATAEYMDLVNGKIEIINDKIATTSTKFEELLANGLSDKSGKKISLTIDQWNAMSNAEREALDLSNESGKALEEIADEYLELSEALEKLRTVGVEQAGKAFDELNDKMKRQVDIFDHYKTLLDSFKDLSDLQGRGITAEGRNLLNQLNKATLENNKNKMRAQQETYQYLLSAQQQLQAQVDAAIDDRTRKEYQEQLDKVTDEVRTAQETILSIYQEGLEKAKDMFTTAVEQSIQDYEAALAGSNKTLEYLQNAFDRGNTIKDRFQDDYERIYQLSKLERSATQAIDDLAKNGMKNNKGLSKILKEINDLQASGAELSDYDLNNLEKRLELEKARADLENARDAKSTVRLQRNQNGTWGYVYTADEDKLADLEQAYEDKLYELQKLNADYANEQQKAYIDLEKQASETYKKIMEDESLSLEERQAKVKEYEDFFISQQEYIASELQKSLDNQGDTYDTALERYKIQNMELVDSFDKTILSQVTGMKTLSELSSNTIDAWNNLVAASIEASKQYQGNIDSVNQNAGTSTADFYTDASGLVDAIGQASEATAAKVDEMGETFIQTFTDVMKEVTDFENGYNTAVSEMVLKTEQWGSSLTNVLGMLNGLGDASKYFNMGLASSATEMGFDATKASQILDSQAVAMMNTSNLRAIQNTTVPTTYYSNDTYNLTINDAGADAVQQIQEAFANMKAGSASQMVRNNMR